VLRTSVFSVGRFDIVCAISIILTSFSIFSLLQSADAQTENWKRFSDPGQKFTFLYPPGWVVNSTHNNINGYTEASLVNPNSSRMKVSVVYNPKDSSLYSDTGKPVILSRALADLVDQLSVDYVYFNSTGKFLHKYSIQNYTSASNVIDYEKVEGRAGKMLLIYSKVSDTDTLLFTYMESKRLFYKQLPVVSMIIKSVTTI
jgi:hypothetical protein